MAVDSRLIGRLKTKTAEQVDPELVQANMDPIAAYGPAYIDKKETIGENFRAGVESGAFNLQAQNRNFRAAIATLRGDDTRAAQLLGDADEFERRSSVAMAGADTFEEALMTNPSARGFFNQIASATGQFIPSLAASLAEAVIVGGVVAGGTILSGGTATAPLVAGYGAARFGIGQAGKAGAKKILKDQTFDRLRRRRPNMTPQQIETLFKKAYVNANLAKQGAKPRYILDGDDLLDLEDIYAGLRGSLINRRFARGAVLGAYSQEQRVGSGIAFGDYAEYDTASSANALRSLAQGQVFGTIGLAAEATVAGSLLKSLRQRPKFVTSGSDAFRMKTINKSSFFKDVGTATFVTSLSEGIAEGLQEELSVQQRMRIDENYTAAQAKVDRLGALFAGFFGGVGVGAGLGAGSGVINKTRSLLNEGLTFEALQKTFKTRLGNRAMGNVMPERAKALIAQFGFMKDVRSNKDSSFVDLDSRDNYIEAQPEIESTFQDGTQVYQVATPNGAYFTTNESKAVTFQNLVSADPFNTTLQEQWLAEEGLGYSRTRGVGDNAVVGIFDSVSGEFVHYQTFKEELADDYEAAEAKMKEIAGDVPIGPNERYNIITQPLSEHAEFRMKGVDNSTVTGIDPKTGKLVKEAFYGEDEELTPSEQAEEFGTTDPDPISQREIRQGLAKIGDEDVQASINQYIQGKDVNDLNLPGVTLNDLQFYVRKSKELQRNIVSPKQAKTVGELKKTTDAETEISSFKDLDKLSDLKLDTKIAKDPKSRVKVAMGATFSPQEKQRYNRIFGYLRDRKNAADVQSLPMQERAFFERLNEAATAGTRSITDRKGKKTVETRGAPQFVLAEEVGDILTDISNLTTEVLSSRRMEGNPDSITSSMNLLNRELGALPQDQAAVDMIPNIGVRGRTKSTNLTKPFREDYGVGIEGDKAFKLDMQDYRQESRTTTKAVENFAPGAMTVGGIGTIENPFVDVKRYIQKPTKPIKPSERKLKSFSKEDAKKKMQTYEQELRKYEGYVTEDGKKRIPGTLEKHQDSIGFRIGAKVKVFNNVTKKQETIIDKKATEESLVALRELIPFYNRPEFDKIKDELSQRAVEAFNIRYRELLLSQGKVTKRDGREEEVDGGFFNLRFIRVAELPAFRSASLNEEVYESKDITEVQSLDDVYAGKPFNPAHVIVMTMPEPKEFRDLTRLNIKAQQPARFELKKRLKDSQERAKKQNKKYLFFKARDLQFTQPNSTGAVADISVLLEGMATLTRYTEDRVQAELEGEGPRRVSSFLDLVTTFQDQGFELRYYPNGVESEKTGGQSIVLTDLDSQAIQKSKELFLQNFEEFTKQNRQGQKVTRPRAEPLPPREGRRQATVAESKLAGKQYLQAVMIFEDLVTGNDGNRGAGIFRTTKSTTAKHIRDMFGTKSEATKFFEYDKLAPATVDFKDMVSPITFSEGTVENPNLVPLASAEEQVADQLNLILSFTEGKTNFAQMTFEELETLQDDLLDLMPTNIVPNPFDGGGILRLKKPDARQKEYQNKDEKLSGVNSPLFKEHVAQFEQYKEEFYKNQIQLQVAKQDATTQQMMVDQQLNIVDVIGQPKIENLQTDFVGRSPFQAPETTKAASTSIYNRIQKRLEQEASNDPSAVEDIKEMQKILTTNKAIIEVLAPLKGILEVYDSVRALDTKETSGGYQSITQGDVTLGSILNDLQAMQDAKPSDWIEDTGLYNMESDAAGLGLGNPRYASDKFPEELFPKIQEEQGKANIGVADSVTEFIRQEGKKPTFRLMPKFNKETINQLTKKFEERDKLLADKLETLEPFKRIPVEAKPDREKGPINVFWSTDDNKNFSNLAPRPFTSKDGNQYLSVEHAFQVNKNGEFNKAVDAKYKKLGDKQGQKIQGPKPTKTTQAQRSKLLKQAMLESFAQNQQAKDELLATGNRVFTHKEGGAYKTIFPQLLMQVRTELRGGAYRSASDTLGQINALQPQVVIKGSAPKVRQAEAKGEGVNVLRKPGNQHYGNPFTHLPQFKTRADVQVGSLKEAVDRYKGWLFGSADTNVQQERRSWILKQIDEGALDGQKLLYHVALTPNHAIALRDFVNYRRAGGETAAASQTRTQPTPAQPTPAQPTPAQPTPAQPTPAQQPVQPSLFDQGLGTPAGDMLTNIPAAQDAIAPGPVTTPPRPKPPTPPTPPAQPTPVQPTPTQPTPPIPATAEPKKPNYKRLVYKTQIVNNMIAAARRLGLETNLYIMAAERGTPNSAIDHAALNIDKAQFEQRRDELLADTTKAAKTIKYQHRDVIMIKSTPEYILDEGRFYAAFAKELGNSFVWQELEKSLKNPVQRKQLDTAFQKAKAAKDSPAIYRTKDGFNHWFADQMAMQIRGEMGMDVEGTKYAAMPAPTKAWFKRLVKNQRGYFKIISPAQRKRFNVDETFNDYMQDLGEIVRNPAAAHTPWDVKAEIEEMTEVVLGPQSPSSKQILKLVKQLQKMLRTKNMPGWMQKIFLTADTRMRNYDSHPTAGTELADFFNQDPRSESASGAAGLFTLKNALAQRLQTDAARIVGVKDGYFYSHLTEEQNAVAVEASNDEVNASDMSPKAKKLREYLNTMYTEHGLKDYGVRFRKNFFPIYIDVYNLVADKTKQEKLIDKMFEKNKALKKKNGALVYPNLKRGTIAEKVHGLVAKGEGMIEYEAGSELDIGVMQARKKYFDVLTNKEYTDIGVTAHPMIALKHYFDKAAMKITFKQKGGTPALEKILKKLNEAEREDATKIIASMFGKIPPIQNGYLRMANNAALLLNIVTLLGFTVIASLQDTAGPILRSRGTAKFSEVAATLKTMFKNPTEAANFAREIGVIGTDAMSSFFIYAGEVNFMNDTSRNIADWWFRITGLEAYTRFTRIFAAGMGTKFLINHAGKAKLGDPTSQQYLRELNVTWQQVEAWSKGKAKKADREKVNQALAQFVDESIVRPNPAQRPTYANDPRWAVVWQLKSFFYAYGKTIVFPTLKEAHRTARTSGLGAGMIPLLLMASMLIPITMIGWELREFFKYGLAALLPGIAPDDPGVNYYKTNEMTWGQYWTEVIDRSGMLGPFTLAMPLFSEHHRYGKPMIIPPLGPTAERIYDGFTGEMNAVDFIPVYSQLDTRALQR